MMGAADATITDGISLSLAGGQENSPDGGVALQQPGQLSMRANMRLHKDGRLVRVDARGQIQRCRFPGRLEQIPGLMRHGDRMHVHHTEKGVCEHMQLDVVTALRALLCDY